MKRIVYLVRKKVVPVVGLVWGVAIVYYGFSNGFGDTGRLVQRGADRRLPRRVGDGSGEPQRSHRRPAARMVRVVGAAGRPSL